MPNQSLTAEEVRSIAAEAVKASPYTRSALAERLDVTPSAVSFALNPGRDASRYIELLSRIVAEVSDYKVETEPVYRYVRKG